MTEVTTQEATPAMAWGKAPNIEQLTGTETSKLVANGQMTIAILPTNGIDKGTLENAEKFGSHGFSWRKKDELLIEISKLSQLIKDGHKYNIHIKDTVNALLSLEKAGFLGSVMFSCRLTAYFYKKECYPVFFVDDRNTLLVAPVVED